MACITVENITLQTADPGAVIHVPELGVDVCVGSGVVVEVNPGVPGAAGTPGANGTNGTNGLNGWSPVLAVATDGERRVLQVADWTGGTGTKPTTGLYIGVSGLVADIASGVDIRGAAGSAADVEAYLLGLNQYDTHEDAVTSGDPVYIASKDNNAATPGTVIVVI